MKRKKKTKIKKSTLAVTTFLILLAVILIIAIFSGQKNQTPTKPPAREYFKIDGVFAWGTPSPQNQTLKIKMLSFNLTSIKGDAHWVHINPGGAIPTDDWPDFPEIKCNQTEYTEINYQTQVLALKWKDGYNFTIRLWCEETSWNLEDQKVTVYIRDWFPF